MVPNLLQNISDGFWSEYVWLPPGVTWKDLESNETKHFPVFNDIYYPIFYAGVLAVLRYLLEGFVFRPLGIFCGLRPVRVSKAQIADNPFLEKAYKSCKGKPDYKTVQTLSKELRWTDRQVERWFRIRRMGNKPSTLIKFSECCWRFVYYAFIFFYNITFLWDKPWLWDIMECWYNFPYDDVIDGLWWLYMIQLSFYWSLLITQFFDVKRKDFWEMFIHHITTISLIVLSWTCNLIRIGSLVLVIHDCADIFLECAKMCKYIKWQRVCDTLFAIFTVVWIVSRVFVFPMWILNSTCFEAKKVVPMFPAYYIFNSMLLILLGLHIVWTYFIMKVLHRALISGQMEKDSRSSSSETDYLTEDEQVTSASSGSSSHKLSKTKKNK